MEDWLGACVGLKCGSTEHTAHFHPIFIGMQHTVCMYQCDMHPFSRDICYGDDIEAAIKIPDPDAIIA